MQQTLDRLQKSGRFPAHGWVTGPKGETCLVFPILRCFRTFEEGVTIKEARIRGFFREMFLRILTVLRHITDTEAAVRGQWPEDGTSIEEYAKWREAFDLLPMYVELFFGYFRLLADRFTIAIAPTVSRSPQSFPKEYKALLKAARNGVPLEWGWNGDPAAFLHAVQTHAEWFELLVGPIGECPKGIRDTLNHRLVAISNALIGDHPRDSFVSLHFDGIGSDIPRVELLSAVGAVTSSFSRFLSAMPADLWRPQNYERGDFAMIWNSEVKSITSRFPQIM